MPISVSATTRATLVTLLGLSVVALSACGGSGPESAPTPKPQTADQAGKLLAERLTAGDLGDFPVKSGDPARDWPEIVKGMGGVRPAVTVDQTIRNGNGATVNLVYTWPLAYPWTYKAKATLANEEGRWKLVWKPEAVHPQLSDETRLERTVGESTRAGVTGANNAVLVGSGPALMVGIDKNKVRGAEAETAARALAERLLIDPDGFARKVAEAPDGVVVDAIGIHRNGLPPNGLDGIPGAVQREMTLPVGRDPGFARSLVGTVTTATAAEAARSQGKVGAGDVVGRSGLQEKFDDQLRGGGASKVFLAPRMSNPGVTRPTNSNLIADIPEHEGTTLVTTIDASLQTAAEDALVTANVPIAVVAVRVSDGAVLAAAESQVGRGRPDSTTGEFRPGLAAGPVAVLALVRSGAKTSDKVDCEKSVTVDGRAVERPAGSSASGSMTLAQAVARGCAPAVARLAGRAQPQAVTDAARTLGLTGTPDLGFAAKQGALADITAEGPRAQAMAGTDAVTASPLGLATMAASVASGRAQLPWATESLHPKADAPLSGDEAKALQEVMKAGASSVSVSGVVGALEGEADGRDVVVAYTKDVAYAVVVGDAKNSKVSATSLLSKMQAAAARSGSVKKSGSDDSD